MKDIIRRILKEEIDYSLPITLTGSYRLPDDIKSKGDALHSFDRRQSDKFGGYMLRGKPIPSRWSSFVTLDQGVGINEVLRKLNSKGIKTDVTDLKVTVNKDSVDWQATIDESKDGKSYIGVHSRGSAGDGADSRALAQIPMLKSKNPKFCNWTEVLDLNITKPIKIRQFFLKYTKCKEDEEPNEETIEKNDELEMEFKDWVPGIYKLDTDKIWTYRLTDDKEWEAKKDDMDFVSLKDSLSD